LRWIAEPCYQTPPHAPLIGLKDLWWKKRHHISWIRNASLENARGSKDLRWKRHRIRNAPLKIQGAQKISDEKRGIAFREEETQP
jgi:hypothetical protein